MRSSGTPRLNHPAAGATDEIVFHDAPSTLRIASETFPQTDNAGFDVPWTFYVLPSTNSAYAVNPW